MVAVATELTTRQRIRSWWKDALNGKEDVRVADLARDAETELGLDDSFREGFVETFLYAVLYDCGISMLSERRAALGEDGEWIGDPSRWMEYEPLSGRHIAFERMTPDQARAAAEFREARVKTELERIDALKRVAEGVSVDSVLKSIPTAEDTKTLMNGKVHPFWREQGLTTKETVGEALDELIAQAGDDDRLVNCRFCGTEIGVRFGECFTPGDDVCEKCLTNARNLMLEGVLDPKHDGRTETCLGCGIVCHLLETDPDPGSDGPYYCGACSRTYPSSLLKAFHDPFNYALKLRTGEIIEFHYAELRGEWIRLTESGGYEGNNFYNYDANASLPFRFDRGIDVRLADIVWCCDCPGGS